ncbi:response regulator [Terriglobus roseus]|uniref:Two-component system, NarL family, capsular synthesis sensor histidine kinase RcsC n=1 Tax=Terriglobus roseus TaxID=392734 RepID=A0A1G7JNH3_9BACT|nr:response regulator [Terriglobus roseus]SDF26463.1 two-component system, NarL family, capsular synthesis sensor histidine kinase RcsC [Terriglobus roseus]
MTLAESTVLVVDDEPILRLTFSIVLQRTGARVLTADDGAEALRIVEADPVDLILTDKQMPNVNGMALLRQLRERGVMTPVILFVNVLCQKTRQRWNDSA